MTNQTTFIGQDGDTMPIFKELSAKWGWVLFSGLLTILFGALAFWMPWSAVLAMTILFGAYAMADGVLSIVFALRRGNHGEGHYWPLLLRGALGVFAGVIVLVMPGISTLSLVAFSWGMLAIWSIATGLLELIAAVRLRHEIEGEWLLGLLGLVSIIFGASIPVLLWQNPAAGIAVMGWMIGLYAFAHGILEVWLAFGLRKLSRL
jgi:uncharacterized membrane protein HdeD (DUF308 family)